MQINKRTQATIGLLVQAMRMQQKHKEWENLPIHVSVRIEEKEGVAKYIVASDINDRETWVSGEYLFPIANFYEGWGVWGMLLKIHKIQTKLEEWAILHRHVKRAENKDKERK